MKASGPRRPATGMACLCLLFALCNLAACSATREAPPCPFHGNPDQALSAGCYAVTDQGLLLVQALNGEISLPGGKSIAGEAAQCTAFRETWEETGLKLEPGELVRVFDTGFHLYNCRHMTDSGSIDPPFRLEIRAAFYLHRNRFNEYRWRFPEQRDLLTEMLEPSR